jgi:membrane fusion protein (multidrug efflux system)
MNRRNLFQLAFASGISAILLLPSCKEKENTNQSETKPSALPAKVHVVKEETLENTIRTTGTLFANEEVILKSEVPGKVVLIGFQEGDFVKKGQLLFRIDESELIAQKEKVTVQLSLARKELERSKGLFEIQAVSQEEYDNAANKTAELEAEYKLLDARIGKSSVYAPFDGQTGLRYISPGAFVATGETLANLIQHNPIKVDFSIPEIYASQVKAGQSIMFTLAGGQDTFSAKVYALEPKINAQSRNMSIRALLNNPGKTLIPGAFVEITVFLDLIRDALLVPGEAIVPVLNGQKVYLIKNGKAVSTNVSTGIRTAENVQITQGLSPGDSVLTTGILQVREGANIQPVNVK